MQKANTIDEFISQFPAKQQKLMQQLRKTILKAAPNAGETISYGIPTFTLHGNLVHFSAYEHHIGFYPGAAGIANFMDEIAKYKFAKGSVQFPIDEPMPLDLIKRITKFRIQQNTEKALKKNLRTCTKGHQYLKSSDCPTCPICEKERAPKEGFMSVLSAPARRALENEGIKTLKQLAKYSEAELLALHGIGATTIPKLNAALKNEKLKLKSK